MVGEKNMGLEDVPRWIDPASVTELSSIALLDVSFPGLTRGRHLQFRVEILLVRSGATS